MHFNPESARRNMTLDHQNRQQSLHWQSQLLMLLIVPLTGAFVLLECLGFWPSSPAFAVEALAIGVAFALLVWALRAATPAAACTGGLFTASLYLWTPGWHTLLWPLLALFLLTFAATRFGRRRKEAIGTAEGKRGRAASQVERLARGCGEKIRPLRVLRLISALNIAVDVGFVVGTMAQINPTGSMIVTVPALWSSSSVPQVCSFL